MQAFPFTILPQSKKKTTKKGKIEIKKEAFMKLTDDEKNDLVSQEIELVQAEIDQVRVWLQHPALQALLLEGYGVT
jgi:hypothetical protein